MSLRCPNGVQASGRKERGNKHVAEKGESPRRECCKESWCLSRAVRSQHVQRPDGRGCSEPCVVAEDDTGRGEREREEGSPMLSGDPGLSPETPGARYRCLITGFLSLYTTDSLCGGLS